MEVREAVEESPGAFPPGVMGNEYHMKPIFLSPKSVRDSQPE